MANNTYVALDAKIVASNTPSVEFTSIPADYTDLVIIGTTGSTASEDYLQMVFNSDTNANYCAVSLSGNGSNANPGRQTSRNSLWLDWNVASDNTISKSLNVSIMNYRNTTTYKNILTRGYRPTSTTPTYTGLELQSGQWRKSPEAITSILLKYNTGNSILAGSTFYLYGIKSEETSSKATGGYITSDDNYFYHTFVSSGTFIPRQSISADILAIAGGGGGGGHLGGGGGAGGVISFSAQALSSGTTYTVTVGAGGASTTNMNNVHTNGVNSTFGALTAAVGGGRGGGAGGTPETGNSGGSGGGGAGTNGSTALAGGSSTQTGSGASAFYGNSGGTGSTGNTVSSAAGGGGAGAAGSNGVTGVSGGAGGIGTNAFSSWTIPTGTGVGGFFAGGGGGGADSRGSASAGGAGGTGGGGAGIKGANPTVATSGTANTGGGGGGGSAGDGGTQTTSGAGGSGIVIVRYLKA